MNQEQQTDATNESTSRGARIDVGRRTFFIGSIAGGTLAAFGALNLPNVKEGLADKLDEMSLPDRLLSEIMRNQRSGLYTAVETVLSFVAAVKVGDLADRIGIPHGGHAAVGEVYEEEVNNNPLGMYIQNSLIIPVVEEAIFRLLPSALFAEEQGAKVKLHWKTGFAATAVFGAVHNFGRPDDKTISFHLDSLPLEQLILGAYCWYAQRKGGFVHAAGAHVLYNNLCDLYAKHFERAPKENPKSTET